MLFIVLGTLVLLLAPAGWFFWPLMIRASVQREFRPSIHLRVEAILAAGEGVQATPEVLADLQEQIAIAVRDTLIDLHYEGEPVTVMVSNDDILGPVCRLHTAAGKEMSLAEFEARLRS